MDAEDQVGSTQQALDVLAPVATVVAEAGTDVEETVPAPPGDVEAFLEMVAAARAPPEDLAAPVTAAADARTAGSSIRSTPGSANVSAVGDDHNARTIGSSESAI